jgi:hypothetical protein
MATLSLPRFQELACEVLFEIEKRFSWLPEEYEQNSRVCFAEQIYMYIAQLTYYPCAMQTGRGTVGSNNNNGPRSPLPSSSSSAAPPPQPSISSRGGRFSNSQSSSAGGTGRESSLRQLQQQQQQQQQLHHLETSHSIGNKSPRHHADTSNKSMVSPDEIDRIRADYEFKLAKMEQQLRDSSVEDQLIDLENQLSEQKKVFCVFTLCFAFRNLIL